MTTETEWRATKYGWNIDRTTWIVSEYQSDKFIREIAKGTDGLDEPTALQMVADHGKAALCEELADALETYHERLTDGRRGLTEDMAEEWTEEIHGLLTKAGRAPQ